MKIIGMMLALVIALAGCSKSSDSAGGDGAKVSKAEYVTQAEAVCKETEDAVKNLKVPGDPTTATDADMEEWATYFSSVNEALGESSVKLTKLPTPDADAQAVDEFYGAYAKAVTASAATEAAAKAGKADEFKTAFKEFDDAGKASDEKAKAAGLNGCVGE